MLRRKTIMFGVIQNNRETVSQNKLAWTLKEVSEATGLSLPFLRKEVKDLRLIAKRFGRRVVILESDLKNYLLQGSIGNQKSLKSSGLKTSKS